MAPMAMTPAVMTVTGTSLAEPIPMATNPGEQAVLSGGPANPWAAAITGNAFLIAFYLTDVLWPHTVHINGLVQCQAINVETSLKMQLIAYCM